MTQTYCRIINGRLIYPFDLADLRTLGVVFGENPSPTSLAKFGVHHVFCGPKPDDQTGHVWERATDPVEKHGLFELEWIKRSQTPEEQQRQRAELRVSMVSVRLALGETKAARLDATLNYPETPWSMRQVFEHASTICRASQAADELAFLTGLTEADLDSLFTQASEVDLY